MAYERPATAWSRRCEHAAGKQPDSRFVALGTRPAAHDHWFARMLAGGADYAQSHAAADGDPPFQRRTWAKANPSLDHMPDLEAAIRQGRRMKRKPTRWRFRNSGPCD